MRPKQAVSRRTFVGGLSAALGYLGLERPGALRADELGALLRDRAEPDPYDGMAKLANNENPYGPSDAVLKAMTQAWKYANRYGYPDGDIELALAKHHGVPRDNILMAAGSGEILKIVGVTFLEGGKKVIGVEPSYTQVYQHATRIRADAIRIPLLPDYRQDIPALIRTTRLNYRDVGFVYLCSPNNPTGGIVTAQEVRQLLDGIPEDVPVLIDEAYHHYVTDPAYATSVPYVLEGRQVIVARTFSKIAGLAGMRLGYAVAPVGLIQRMQTHSTGSINALVKWGGVAALQDTESQARVKKLTLELRDRTTAELKALGHDVIPSQANFFMVHIGRPVQPVIEAFQAKGVLVGRPFPPMLQHLRVSVGTAEEMGRFMTAFREIFPASKTAAARSG